MVGDQRTAPEGVNAELKIPATPLHVLIVEDSASDAGLVLRELRKDEALRHIPVIAATASAMKGDRETILAHGFDGYLSKPLDADLLQKILQEALD